MEHHSKLKIYKGIIQYLLESTNYTFKDIAHLSDTSIKNIQSIYYEDHIPHGFTSERQLVRIFQFVLGLNLNELNALRGHQ